MKVRLLTVSTVTANGKIVPAVRICGDWLSRIGFEAGKKVILQEKPGQLMIQLISVQEEGILCE